MYFHNFVVIYKLKFSQLTFDFSLKLEPAEVVVPEMVSFLPCLMLKGGKSGAVLEKFRF